VTKLLRINSEVLDRLKIRAAEVKRPMGEMAEEWIDEKLSKPKPQPKGKTK